MHEVIGAVDQNLMRFVCLQSEVFQINNPSQEVQEWMPVRRLSLLAIGNDDVDGDNETNGVKLILKADDDVETTKLTFNVFLNLFSC